MRAIRYALIAVLAIVLILIAAANRAPVTISMMPEGLAQFFGGQWALTMPGFLALFLAMVFGLIVGLVWEWLREAGLRAESKARAQQLARLENAMGDLHITREGPRDEVLAILDESAARKPGASSSLPATR